jgi:hypothetical protein
MSVAIGHFFEAKIAPAIADRRSAEPLIVSGQGSGVTSDLDGLLNAVITATIRERVTREGPASPSMRVILQTGIAGKPQGWARGVLAAPMANLAECPTLLRLRGRRMTGLARRGQWMKSAGWRVLGATWSRVRRVTGALPPGAA